MQRLYIIVICVSMGVGTIMGEELEPYFVPGYPTIVVWPLGTENANYPAFWHTNFHTSEGDMFNLTNKIVGDSIVNGKTYGRMYFYYETKDDLLTSHGLYETGQPYEKTEYADTLLYRQEGDKVFCIPKGEKEEVLIVDFGLKVDEEFVDASKEKYRVTMARPLKNGYDTEWSNIGGCKVMCHYFYSEPKVLELISINTGEKDIWVEGIGSLKWGVVPPFIAEGIEPFRQLGQHPQRAQVCVAKPENMTVMPDVNEDDYKAVLIERKRAYDGDVCIDYSFEGDTLCVNGIQNSESTFGYPYAECLITDNRIDFMLKQNAISRIHKLIFNVRIPGFKAGTYQVGMPGQKHVTLECMGNGSTIVNDISISPALRNALYDLSGRRLQQKPQKGIYIQDGKVLVK